MTILGHQWSIITVRSHRTYRFPDMIWLPNGVYLGPVMTCKGSGGRNISGSWNATSAILTMSLTSTRGDFIVPTSNHQVKNDTTKIYEIDIKIGAFLYTHSCHSLEMSIMTKCLPVIRVVRGIQTIMWGRHGLSTIIERSIIGGGLIL